MKAKSILDAFKGNKTLAARSLRVSRPTLYKWLRLQELPEEAKMRMRDWFIREHGEIPKAWMPK